MQKEVQNSTKCSQSTEESGKAGAYSNIPPKEVREKREQEMRDAYDELLAVGDGRKKKKPTPKPQRREELEDDFYDDIEEEEEKMSKAPIIILAIAIIVVAGLIAFMLLR